MPSHPWQLEAPSHVLARHVIRELLLFPQRTVVADIVVVHIVVLNRNNPLPRAPRVIQNPRRGAICLPTTPVCLDIVQRQAIAAGAVCRRDLGPMPPETAAPLVAAADGGSGLLCRF